MEKGETKMTKTQFQDLDPSILQFSGETVASILNFFFSSWNLNQFEVNRENGLFYFRWEDSNLFSAFRDSVVLEHLKDSESYTGHYNGERKDLCFKLVVGHLDIFNEEY